MIDLNCYIPKIKELNDAAKTIAEAFPVPNRNIKDIEDLLLFVAKHWEEAEPVVSEYITFSKRCKITRMTHHLLDGIDSCPLLYLNNNDGIPQPSIFRVVENDSNEESLVLHLIKHWTISRLFTLILQNKYLLEELKKRKDYKLKEEQDNLSKAIESAINRLIYSRALKSFEDEMERMDKKHKKKRYPFLKLVSVPMGGQNKKR